MSTSNTHYLTPPLTEEDTKKLKAGDKVFITGTIYTARDAAHKRLVDLLDEGKDLPFDPEGAVIYYVGPAPPKPGMAVGSAGPTTAYRMDPYAVRMMEVGIKGMIAKGKRSNEVRDAIKKHKAVYLAAVGGAGALIGKSIKEAEIIAFKDLGPEAVRRLVVENFPAIVINDPEGTDQYELVAQGKA